MKKIKYIGIMLFMLSSILLIGCDKEPVNPLTQKAYNTGIGEVMFWVGSKMSCGNITVTCGGTTRPITGFNTTQSTERTNPKYALFSLPIGTYGFSATCNGGKKWEGTIDVTDGSSLSIQLTNAGVVN